MGKLKQYTFEVKMVIKVKRSQYAESEEEALEQLKCDYRKDDSVEINLESVKNAAWIAERCSIAFGAQYSDEYERIQSNHEQLGPFNSVEEALTEIRSQWEYTGDFVRSFKMNEESYMSTDYNLNGIKEYTICAKEVA